MSLDVNVSLYSRDEFDALQARVYLLVSLYLGVLLVLGLVGNSAVCLVYTCRFRSSTTRCFILTMAVLDLVNCLTTLPAHIVELNHVSTFGSFHLCEALMMTATFFSIASALVLLAVAADRYSLICRHNKRQFDPASATRVCVLCCCLTAVFVLPAPFMYGPRTVNRGQFNATVCGMRDIPSSYLYHLVYIVIQMSIFLVACVTLIVLYGLIWRQVKRQQTLRRRMSLRVNSLSADSNSGQDRSPATSSSVCSCIRPSPDTSDHHNDGQSVQYDRKEESVALKPIDRSVHSASPVASASSSEGQKSRQRSGLDSTPLPRDRLSTLSRKAKQKKESRKLSFMLFLISIVFIASYLPYLAVLFVDESVIDSAPAIFGIIERSYFIQSVSNPIIYSLCNNKFRYHLKRAVLMKLR